MMRQKKTASASVTRLMQYKYFRRILLSSLAIALVLVIATGTLFISAYNYFSREQMLGYAQDMMAQRVYGTSLLWEEMESLASAIYSNTNISNFLYAKSDEKLLRYYAGRDLSKYKALYTFIQNISLVNLRSNVYTSTLNYGDDLAFFSEYATLGNILWVPRIIPAPSFRYTDLFVLSMIYPIRLGTEESCQCGIIIDIDQKHLQSLLQFTDVDPGASTVIVDRQGIVTSATSKESFLSSYAERAYMPQILSSGERQGSFAWADSGVQNLVIWERLEGRDWTVISVIPASNLQMKYEGIIKAVTLGLTLLLLLAVIFVIFSSRRVYRPIQELVREVGPGELSPTAGVHNEIEAVAQHINSIQQDHAELKKTMHLTMVQHLVLGLPVDVQAHDTVLRDAHAYCVAIVRLMEQKESDDQLLIATGNVMAKLLQEVCPCETAVWSNTAILILCLQDPILPDTVQLSLETVCEWCQTNLRQRTIAAISSVVTAPEDIHAAYLEAQQNAQQVFYAPQERVFTPAGSRREARESQINAEWWGQRFAALIMDAEEDILQTELAELLAKLSTRAPAQAKQSAHEVASQLYLKLINSGLPQEHSKREILLQAILSAESWEELRRVLYAVMEDCQTLTSSFGQSLRNRKIVHDVCSWVQRHYSDPEMSLQSAADHVGLSASYLGRIFKAMEQQSFTEYVTAVRLEEAARELLETDKTIAVIAHDVGMENQSYFSSLFKKEYGSSPSNYRQTNAAGKV